MRAPADYPTSRSAGVLRRASRAGRWCLLLALSATVSCTAVQVAPSPDALVRQGGLALDRGDTDTAVRAFQETIRTGKDTEAAALARDSLRELFGLRLYPDVLTDCSEDAARAYHAAEEQFAASEFEASHTNFRLAIEACPTSAVIRTAYADVYYNQGDFEQARELFREALVHDPWNRAAWRYLSDTEKRLGNRWSTWEAAMFAVLSDPLYEMGWVTLGHATAGGPAALRRVRIDKPTVSQGENGPVIHLFTVANPSVTKLDHLLWTTYSIAAAGDLGKKPDGTFLAMERRRVELALGFYAENRPTSAESGSAFWDLIEAAKSAGFLDEAIYVHLMDPSLAAEYAQFRRTNRDRLAAYMKTLVAPPPPTANPPSAGV